jgi:hypothetical protein
MAFVKSFLCIRTGICAESVQQDNMRGAVCVHAFLRACGCV